MEYRTWLVTFRIRSLPALPGEQVQRFAQEQAKFLSSQDLGFPQRVDVEVAAIAAPARSPLAKDDVRAGLELMEELGGGFARHLAKAAFAADSGNWALLAEGFGELFRNYQAQAERLPKHGGAS